MTKTSIPRIRSVTEKATGRQLRVLRHDVKNDRKAIDARLADLMSHFFSYEQGAGGFAFVIWDKSGLSMTATSCFPGSTVHKAWVADFVRGCIDKNITKDW